MSEDKFPATNSETGGATHRGSTPASKGQAGRPVVTQRAVGVYERPKGRARLSLSLIVILILSALVSVVAAARFLF